MCECNFKNPIWGIFSRKGAKIKKSKLILKNVTVNLVCFRNVSRFKKKFTVEAYFFVQIFKKISYF